MRQGLGGEVKESWVTLILPQFLSSHPVLISSLTFPPCPLHYGLLHILMPRSCMVWREDTSQNTGAGAFPSLSLPPFNTYQGWWWDQTLLGRRACLGWGLLFN